MGKIVWVTILLLLALRITLFYFTRKTFPDGTRIRITSVVSSEPVRYSNTQYLKLSGFEIYIPLYPEVNLGDRLVVEGVKEGKKLKKAKVLSVNPTNTGLYGMRKRLLEFYQRNLPQPHSSLIAGITLGSKSDIPEEFWNILKSTGTAHIVVASGMNVTLVSQFLISFLALILPRRGAIPIALAGVWGYAVLSGFDAPIVRASIMGSLAFIAQEFGRLNFSIRTLFLTAFAMLFVKPDWISDLGFQLSFLATLTILLFEPKFYKLLGRIPSIIRKDLSTSLAAQIGVSPILLFGFGKLNILSPLINSAVLWTVVPLAVLGAVSGFIGLIYEAFGRFLLLLTYPLTSWFVFFIGIFE